MDKCFLESEHKMCCCNCTHQIKIMKNPSNENDYANGTISSIMGYGCQVPGWNGTIFMDREHSMCEEYDEK